MTLVVGFVIAERRVTNRAREQLAAELEAKEQLNKQLNARLPATLEASDVKMFMATQPPEHILAFIDTRRPLAYSDPKVKFFDTLLTLLDEKYREDRAWIFDKSVTVTTVIQQTQGNASVREILEGGTRMHQLGIEAPGMGWSFAQYLDLYKDVRIRQNKHHVQAMDALLAIERVVYARAEGDQSKQARMLKDADIFEFDDFETRVFKVLAHLEKVSNRSEPTSRSASSETQPSAVRTKEEAVKARVPGLSLQSEPEMPPLRSREIPLETLPYFKKKRLERAETLYKMGQGLEKAKKPAVALGYYEQVRSDYPDSEFAKSAAERIEALRRK